MDTQSWNVDEPNGPDQSSLTTDGPAPEGPAFGGPAPIEPPRRSLPDSVSQTPPGSLSGGTFLMSPPVEPSVSAEPTTVPLLTPAAGWGWRALVAFVAGGLLTGGGFAVGQLSSNENTAAGNGLTPVSVEAAPPRSILPSTTIPLPRDGTTEPAALVARLLGPSVVQINTSTGIGSGVVYGDGLILTNHHVVAGGGKVTVRLHDGREFDAVEVKSDPKTDLAVVKIENADNLTATKLGDSDNVAIGDWVLALGQPFGLEGTVTAGIVSAKGRGIGLTARENFL